MSSMLTQLVPVLDGTNYQQWASAMQSFLMSQGQWSCITTEVPNSIVSFIKDVKKSAQASVMPKKPSEEAVEEEAAPPTSEEVARWTENNIKAVGNIHLRLHHTIGYQFNDEGSAYALWWLLKERYGHPGPSKIYLELKAAMDTCPRQPRPHSSY